MRIHYEFGDRLLQKRGEELCGDNVIFSVLPDSVTLVLSDGLGSGVKANILSTLTSRIASRMIAEGLPVPTVVETISQTLPVCRVRKLAYSTYTVAQFFWNGSAHLIEFDNPHVFRIGDRRIQRVPYEKRSIEGRLIHDARLNLKPGDWLIVVSDGVVNAGIGAASNLGWGWDSIGTYLERHTHPHLSAQDVADDLADKVLRLYEGQPGDDVSIAVVKVRRHRATIVLCGPPLDRNEDEAITARLMSARGERVCCGGTTSRIVARVLARPISVDLSTASKEVPPIGTIEGIDLVTEGVLTLSRTLENLRTGVTAKAVQFKVDGASALTRLLHNADDVTFLVGRAINPAHQDPDLPKGLGLKAHIANEIKVELEKLGKTVTLELH